MGFAQISEQMPGRTARACEAAFHLRISRERPHLKSPAVAKGKRKPQSMRWSEAELSKIVELIESGQNVKVCGPLPFFCELYGLSCNPLRKKETSFLGLLIYSMSPLY